MLTLFLLEDLNFRLRPTILNMKPGTRVVSNTFSMRDWKPEETITPAAELPDLLHGLFLDRAGQGRRQVDRSRRAS